MKFGFATVIAAGMVALIAGPAASQSPWPQAEPQQAAPAPWPQAQPPAQAPAQAAAPAGPSPWDQPAQAAPAPWPAPGQAQQQPAQRSGPDPWSQPPQQAQQQQRDNPCLEQFLTLRKEVEKRGGLLQAASQRKQKPSAQEACGLFNSFTAAEIKMVAYATKNAASCGIPPQVIGNMKEARVKSDEIRTRVCQAAAAGGQQQRAPAPSLSDALTAPVPDSNNIKTGRGTFDTLTGNPLAR